MTRGPSTARGTFSPIRRRRTLATFCAWPRRVGSNGIVLQIGRLGVGTALVRHILATALALNLAAACKAVVVTAIDEQAASWWQRYGFAPFDGRGLDL
jgi:hypothetical protein